MTGPGREHKFRPGGRNRIIDDRRQVVSMLEPAGVPAGAPRDLQAAVERANEHRFPFMLMGYGIGALVLLVELAERIGDGRPPRMWLLLGTLAAMGCVRLVQMLAGRRMVEANARVALGLCLRERLCPSCGYHLQNLTPGDDGCTACPECGAAWKLAGTT